MIIYKNKDFYYIFIHVPKNGGKYTRKQLIDNSENEIIKSYWGICKESNLDLAHIPYIKINNFIDKSINYNYFSYSRNPYDRIISAFFYCNKKRKIKDFAPFVKYRLSQYEFNLDFNRTYIHYYPQYLFLCDENLLVYPTIKIKKLEDCENPPRYDLKLYFCRKSLKIVNEIYKNDFLFFGYNMIDNL